MPVSIEVTIPGSEEKTYLPLGVELIAIDAESGDSLKERVVLFDGRLTLPESSVCERECVVENLEPTRMPDGEVRMMAQNRQSPSLGRVVIFTPDESRAGANGASEYVATIGQVWDDPTNPDSFCNLLVFPPFQEPYWVGSVQQGTGPYSWRWPTRV